MQDEHQPPPIEPQGTPPYRPPAGADKKLAAGIVALLLGELGIHKFILGYTTEGVIMLLITIVGGILTCGLAAVVMWVIGIVEGVMYLNKSDEEFVAVYVHGYRGWF